MTHKDSRRERHSEQTDRHLVILQHRVPLSSSLFRFCTALHLPVDLRAELEQPAGEHRRRIQPGWAEGCIDRLHGAIVEYVVGVEDPLHPVPVEVEAPCKAKVQLREPLVEQLGRACSIVSRLGGR